jgi:hypothetical protein
MQKLHRELRGTAMNGDVIAHKITRAFAEGARDLCSARIWGDIAKRRREWGLEQTYIGKQIGVYQSTYSRWEKYGNCSFKQFLEVLIVLGIKPSQLDWPAVRDRAIAGYLAALSRIHQGSLSREELACLWALHNHLQEWDAAQREDAEQREKQLAELADRVTNEAQNLLGESLPALDDPIRHYDRLYSEWGASWQQCLHAVPLKLQM